MYIKMRTISLPVQNYLLFDLRIVDQRTSQQIFSDIIWQNMFQTVLTVHAERVRLCLANRKFHKIKSTFQYKTMKEIYIL